MMTPPKFQVDFNELVDHGVVLLSKGDNRLDSDGNMVKLAEGMRVVVWDSDLGDDGLKDDLVGIGRVVANSTGHAPHVKWCCLIDSPGVQHQSDWDTGPA